MIGGAPDGPAVRLIGTDIDGTLLRPDGTLSPRVKEAVAAAVEAGIHVVPATGRPVNVARDVIAALELPHYWVFANGAVTRHLGRDELVRGFWMEPGEVRALIERIRIAVPSARLAVEFDAAVAYEPGLEQIVSAGLGVAPVDDVLPSIDRVEHTGEFIQKILVYDLSRPIDELLTTVTAVAGDDAVPSFSGLAFVELAAGEVTKALALDMLAADLGIRRDEVVTFGDNHNDVSMLRWAGRGYAMANGTDEAKAAADEVVPGNDADGLAVQIERILATR